MSEEQTYSAVWGALRGWLPRVAEAVLAPWRKHKAPPDPTAVHGQAGLWVTQVDGPILTALQLSVREGWDAAGFPVPYVSTSSFILASLATTRNLLVRVPDEVADLVFAAIAEAGPAASQQQIAEAIDQVLSATGSERWPGRARVIARTETTRAFSAGMVAAARARVQATGSPLRKRWNARDDDRTRTSHHEVDGVTVPLEGVWWVGGVPMSRPGDELAPPDQVVNCRCRLQIVEVQ